LVVDMNANVARIDSAGRLSISAHHRRALGLEGGGPVVVTLVGDEIRVRSMTGAMSELQADAYRFLQDEKTSVDTFLTERRAEAARERHQDDSQPPSLPSQPTAPAAKMPGHKSGR